LLAVIRLILRHRFSRALTVITMAMTMDETEQFEPRLGPMKARGRSRKFLHRAIASANLAQRSAGSGRARFSGSRMGRGAGAASLLGQGQNRGRRVIIKSRIVRLAGKGFACVKAHLRYIQRDGTTRQGAPGELYDAQADCTDGAKFLERSAGDRHQFRFIVSAEDGADYDDLKPLTRRLMAKMEEDLGTRLEWVAVDHFNTGHPHSHIMLRGKDEDGKDLVIARDYVKEGMRTRACEIVEFDLGPRTIDQVQARLRSEVEQERFTGIDRQLLREARDGLVSAANQNAFDQSIRMGRLKKLEKMGLATPISGPIWRLQPGLDQTLRKMGERGDIIRTMQRALSARGKEVAAFDQLVFEPRSAERALIGRVIDRGLSDELRDRHYLIVEAVDGRTHYVDNGRSDGIEPLANGAVVRIEPANVGVRDVDRTIAAVAAANGGRYDIDAHFMFDPDASEEFVRAHVRRLEAIRRLTGGVERDADDSWAIAPDHLDRVTNYEEARVRDRPVTTEILSPERVEKLVRAEAATWLDRELISDDPEPLRDAGFGRDVRDAINRRRLWLVNEQLADELDGKTTFRPDLIDTLRRRELIRVAGQLSEELGLRFAEARSGERIEGRLVGPVALLSGRHALIERAHDFTLVPWRPVLERQLGKQVAAIIRGNDVSWSFGKQRNAPEIA
jgi:type IV secretory pathway VirD2 relaxase